MKSFILFLLFLTASLSETYAQNFVSIEGRVMGADDLPTDLTVVTVSLLRARDSAVLKVAIPDKNGRFVFERVAAGKYVVAATSVLYKKAYSGIIETGSSTNNINLSPIQLVRLAKSLKEVTVTARRPLIEQKADRIIVNVEASITNLGASALEILEKSPGVTVDNEGAISLKGKEGVLVLIDGRPTQLSGTDLANLLRNMSANQMDQVEIMSNPPARYDAAGNAGIINIKTKKNNIKGYNGSFNLTYGQGRYPKTTEGINLNFRQNKWAISTNLSHNYRKDFRKLNLQRRIYDASGNQVQNYFDQEANMIRHSNSLQAKLGVDYFLNKRTSFGIMLNGFASPSSTENLNSTFISSASKVIQSVTDASVSGKNRWTNLGSNFNFKTILDTTGKELSAEIDLIAYDANNDQRMVNSYWDAAGNPLMKADTLLGVLPQSINIYSARVDYLHPLKKNARFEAGIKSSIIRTDNDVRYDSLQYGMMVPDRARSNHFVYEENINAAYVNISAPLSKRLQSQFGLRLENTVAKGVQLTTGETFDRKYTQLFPTAFLQYKLNKKNSLGLNYGRRIRRPNYESLNPFIRFIDRYTFNEGNPNLKPQFSNNIELSHSFRNIITTSLNYTATNNIIQQVIEQRGQEAFSRPANIAKLRQIGLAININMPVTKWWMNSFNLNVFNNDFTGMVSETPISFSATSYFFRGTQQFILSKTLTAEINGAYRSSRVEGVLDISPIGMMAVGMSKKIMKSKGILRLTINDIFYTQQQKAQARYGNVNVSFQDRRDTRVVNLGFTYLFSKGKMGNQKKKAIGSAGEEQERIDID